MFLTHLTLANFRSYRQLDLQLPAPVVLFQGDNGQGKTNLLEAIYFLATTRSLRAGSDRELIHFAAFDEPIPFARVEGRVRKTRGDLHVEILLRGDRPEQRYAPPAEGGAPHVELSKRIKVNGIARRALDLIGQVNVVTFSPQDLDLVAGSPAGRRRYLDIVNCQVDHRYCRTLTQYNRVLAQRNHLLKQIRENKQPAEMLDYWSEELVKSGAYLLYRRLRTVGSLDQRADGYFHRLTASGKKLKLAYHSSAEEALSRTGGRGDVGTGRASEPGGEAPAKPPGDRRDAGAPPADDVAPGASSDATPGGPAAVPAPTPGDGDGQDVRPPSTQPSVPSPQSSSEDEAIAQYEDLLRRALARYRRREMLQGASLVGPHRDDLSFRADGIDMNVYGSRGEQRVVALALKLSEVAFLQQATGEQPILLLDDVMSELDPSRRALLIGTLDPTGQTLITATDLEPFSPDFLSRAALFRVESGAVTPIDQ